MSATTPRPWPLRTQLELAALSSAVPCARGHVRSVALEWGLPGLADTAELLASELVTNAIQASERLTTLETPVVRLWWPATINEASGGRNAGVIQTGGNAGVIHWSESSINEPLRSGRDLAGWYRALTHRVAFQARGEPCR
jgi:hypothetical protein